jgi:hypothetical protein
MIRVVLAALLTLALGGYAQAEMNVKTVTQSKGSKPQVTKERYVTATATVEAINLEKRVVTLKGENGKVFDLKVGPEARNLPQVKAGDLVTVKYIEAVSAKVYKAGTAPKETGEAAAMERAKLGEKPGGKVVAVSTTTATVEAIDKKKPSVTLKNSDGKSLTVKVEDRKALENVVVGDEVVITYAEAIALSVEKAKKKGK